MSTEYKVDIGGVLYGMENICSCSIERPLFDKLSAGNACSAELDITFWPGETVPKMAKIIPYARENSSDSWKQLGVFYTDTRETSNGMMSIVAYDSMLKAEETLLNSGYSYSNWPQTQSDVVQYIAKRIGVTVDSRTALSSTVNVEYPVDSSGDMTMRKVLREIAAVDVGNWIITDANKLLLVPLFDSMPEETDYLVTDDGYNITFGKDEDRILI
jgi:hypothetical protein